MDNHKLQMSMTFVAIPALWCNTGRDFLDCNNNSDMLSW